MGQRAASNINITLTNFASGLAQDLMSVMANFIAPIVRVGSPIGQYKKYDSKNAFQVYETARGIGGGATRIKFDATDPTFNCLPQALEVGIDDSERGENDAALERAKIRTLITAATIGHEDKVFTAIKAGKAATGSVGTWSSADNSPIEEIDAQIEAISTATGMLPNRIAFGIGAWKVFKNHPKVIARFPGAAQVGITMDQATSLFMNPAMTGKVGILSKDSTKFGKDKSATNIVGSEVFIFYASDAPDVYDPSFAKTFMTGEGGVDAVREYRDESARSDIYAVDWSEDIQVISSDSARRITVA